MLRNALGRQTRLFSTNLRLQKTATDVVKDAAKVVDRKVSDTIVAGLDTATNVAQKAKEVTGQAASEMPTKGQIKGKAQEMSGRIKGTAAEMSGTTSGEIKGTAHEMAGKAKGKAADVQGQVKNTMTGLGTAVKGG